MTQRCKALREAWEMLWRLLIACLWLLGARRENGKTCWHWKRTAKHIILDVMVCAAAFFLKEYIYTAVVQALSTTPPAVYLNVTLSRDIGYRVTRSADPQFFDLASLIAPPIITTTTTLTPPTPLKTAIPKTEPTFKPNLPKFCNNINCHNFDHVCCMIKTSQTVPPTLLKTTTPNTQANPVVKPNLPKFCKFIICKNKKHDCCKKKTIHTSSPMPPPTTYPNPTTSAPDHNNVEANYNRTSANRTPSTKSATNNGKLVLALTILAANTAIILLAVAVAYLYRKMFTRTPTTTTGTTTVDMHSVDLTDTAL